MRKAKNSTQTKKSRKRTATVHDILGVVVVLLFVSLHKYCVRPAFALQPDLVGHALQTASSMIQQPHQLDEIFFAAVNLLDAQRKPLSIFSNNNKNDSGDDDNEDQNVSTKKQKLLPLLPSLTQTRKNNHDNNPSFVFDDDVQPLRYTITLTEDEVQLFQLVQQVRDRHCPSTTLRISGGWVRDKLLQNHHYASSDTTTATTSSTTTSSASNHPSDIDFVLDNKSGTEFAQWLYDYLTSEEYPLLSSSSSSSSSSCGDVTLIDYSGSGSESETSTSTTTTQHQALQSQHLQTASLKVGNLWDLDFCQLRFEKYAPHSRVPAKTGMASVVEDAFRRDLTINALYYNLNTNQVEDWTEQGLDDLQYRVLRTPTAPLPTVLEDPLRLLRAIRFAAQLSSSSSSSFSMDAGLKKTALDQRVRKSLQQKVSKERVGKEIDGIFQTRDPRRGMQLLLETKLMNILFPLPDHNSNKKHYKDKNPEDCYQAGYHLLVRTQTLVSRIFTSTMQWDETSRRYLWYAAFFKPIHDTFKPHNSPQQHSHHQRRRNKSILHQQLVCGLRRPTCDIQSVEKIIRGANTFERFLRVYAHSLILQSLFSSSKLDDDEKERDDLHDKKILEFRWLCYRVLKRIGPLWKESLILALASSSFSSSKEKYTISEAVQLYQDLGRGLRGQLGLREEIIFSLRPLLNGSQIQSRALPGANGKTFRKIMQTQEKWQVTHQCHHAGTAKDDLNDAEQERALIDYLVKEFPQYQ